MKKSSPETLTGGSSTLFTLVFDSLDIIKSDLLSYDGTSQLLAYTSGYCYLILFWGPDLNGGLKPSFNCSWPKIDF